MKTGMLVYCLVLSQAGIGPGVAQQAVGHTDHQAARQLLTDYWPRNLETRRSAEAFYQDLKQAASITPAAEFAWVVNRIHFNRLREALPSATKLTDYFPHDLDAWYTRCWVQMANGETADALVSIRQFGERLKTADPVDEKAIRTGCQRLGRLIAFVGGPLSGRVPGANLEQTVQSLLADLDDPLVQVVNQSRQQVLDQYHALLEEQENVVADTKRQEDAERAETVRNLNEANQTLANRQTGIEQQQAEIREQADSALAKLQGQVVPLQSELGNVEQQLITARNQAAFLTTSLFTLHQQLEQIEDPVICARLAIEVDLTQRLLLDQQMLVANLRAQYDSLGGQVLMLQDRINTLAGRAHATLGSLDDQSSELKAEARRNTRQLSRMSRARTRTGYENRTRARLTRLAEFDPFPAAVLRETLLQRWDQ